MPKVTAAALNETAHQTKAAVMTETVRKVDRPTRQTVDAYAVWQAKARRGRLDAVVLLKDNAKYLTGLIHGGTETKVKVTPGRGARLNQYGNLPRNATKSKGVFHMTTARGFSGYFKPVGSGKSRKLALIGHVPSSRSYRKTIDFYVVAERAARLHFAAAFKKHASKVAGK